MKKSKEQIVAILLTLLSILLADNTFSNPVIKLILVIFAGITAALYLSGAADNNRKKLCASYALAGLVSAAIIISCIIATFPSKSWTWNNLAARLGIIPSTNIYQSSEIDVEQSVQKLQDNVMQTAESLSLLTDMLEAEVVLSEEDYPSEVTELRDIFAEKEEILAAEFPNIKSEPTEVEIFYKTNLYRYIYHYSSFINVFTTYGIDCNALGINEYTLMLWDAENLYTIYAMKKSIEMDAKNDVYYEEKSLKFNDFRVDLNQYSDLTNYGDWQFSYENTFAKEIEEQYDSFIMNYYKKFHLNFKKDSN